MVVILDACRKYGVNSIFRSQYGGDYLKALYVGLSELFGFALLFLSFGYLLFSFLEERNFDGAIRRIALYSAVCALGYLLVGGFLANQNISHLAMLISTAIPFLFN